MDFLAVVDQVATLLQQRSRVTYRALQRQFALDAAALADLTEALLYAFPVVEDGRGLVWTGEPVSPEAAPPPGTTPASRGQALLPAVMLLLQYHRRMTYRALTEVLSLDAPLLAALRAELTFRQVARDEQGEGLVWTGEAPTWAPPVAPLLSPPLPAVPLEVRSPNEPPPPQLLTPWFPTAAALDPDLAPEAPSTAPEAERRHLTVMFCDLADSTQLAQQLDPEALREVIRAYQQTSAAVLEPYAGHIAQYLGDGLLIYFGWPVAHEDDAQRAVHAALGLVAAVTTTLNPRLAQAYGVQLTVRLGIHTGPVVVGAMGGGGRQEHLATGDTVNIAARLEGLAAPNTVLLSAMTARLVQETFTLQDLGLQALKGVATPMRLFRVQGLLEDLDYALEAVGASFLVGRDEELGLLRRRWAQSQAGQGQVVLLSGEAGIGKSSLVAALRQQVGQEGATRHTFQCSPYHTTSALYPVLQHLQRLLHWAPETPPATRLARLEDLLRSASRPLAEVVPLYAALLALPLPDGRYPALALPPQQLRQQTLDALVEWLLEDTTRQPTLTLWEDLHWADPSTLELLGLLLEQTPTVPLLHVLTFRPEFTPPWPPRAHLTPITLNRLVRPQVEALLTHLAGGKGLPAEVVAHIVAKTDGVPLYVEELTKMLLDSPLLREEAMQYELTGPLGSVAIPDSLQAALLARLDQLPGAKEIAQLGAVLGREFPYALLQALAAQDEGAVQGSLEQLVAAELLYQRGRPPRATYVFKHALIQEAAYASLLRSTRQQRHQQVVQLLETRFPEVVTTQPELLAQHCAAAGQGEVAVRYWQQAGQRALEGSAHAEAIAHLTQGLAMLTTLPEAPARLHQELDLQVALGAALVATKGIAAVDVERAYARARVLCQQLGDTPQIFSVLRGLLQYDVAQGQLQEALQLGEQLLCLAEAQPDPAPRMLAHYQLGMVVFFRGEPGAAQAHHRQALALYTPQEQHALAVRYGTDLGVMSHGWLAWELWSLGWPAQAIHSSQAACTLAQEVAHPYSLALALLLAAVVQQWRRETPATYELAAAASTLATTQGFTLWGAYGTSLHGWALALQGQREQGILAIRQGLAAELATGSTLMQPYFLALLAEAYGASGRLDEGLAVLTEAREVLATTEIRFYAAELARLQGALLLQHAVQATAPAEACFQEALAIARQQQARSWELRAATSLARLWQSQGKCQEAFTLLAPVYEWFTEGFDTPDLQDAKALLAELS